MRSVSTSAIDGETRRWLDLHCGIPVEELTFGRLLSGNPLARVIIPRRLAAARRRLLALAAANPDLDSVYAVRADVFAARLRTFDPQRVQALERYSCAARARPSFTAADIRTHLHVGRLVAGYFGFAG